MDRQEIASFTASTLSALLVGATVVYHALETLLPVLLIILTVSLSFLFTRLNSRDTRKYEIRRVAIDEALGPIYGEVLRIQEEFDKLQAELSIRYIGFADDVWGGIRHSHRFFVIQEPLRSVIEGYFARFSRFNREQQFAYDDIFEIEKQVWPQILEIRDMNQSAQFRIKRGDDFLSSNIQAALFWGINPNSLSDGPYDYFSIQGVGLDGKNTNLNQSNLQGIRDIIEKAWNLTFPQVEKVPRVLKIRKDRADLMTETTRLRLMLEEEFSKWAGK